MKVHSERYHNNKRVSMTREGKKWNAYACVIVFIVLGFTFIILLAQYKSLKTVKNVKQTCCCWSGGGLDFF